MSADFLGDFHFHACREATAWQLGSAVSFSNISRHQLRLATPRTASLSVGLPPPLHTVPAQTIASAGCSTRIFPTVPVVVARAHRGCKRRSPDGAGLPCPRSFPRTAV